MRKMWKRIICSILIAATIFTELPVSAMAASDTANTETGTRVFGDADGDGKLNEKDIAMILRYIVEDDPSGFHDANADVTEDGTVDLKDLLAIRKRMTGAEYADKGSTRKKAPAAGKPSAGNVAQKIQNDSVTGESYAANQGQRPSQPLESVISGSLIPGNGNTGTGNTGSLIPGNGNTGSEDTETGNTETEDTETGDTETEDTETESPGDTTTTTTYYQVTFALGSGQDSIDLPEAKTYAAGTRIDTLPTPVRQDVVFMGWHYDAALTQPVGDSDTVDRNMTLYARTDGLDGLDIQESPNYITAADVESTFQLQLSGTHIDPADLTVIQVSANNAEVPFTVDSNGNVTITGGWEHGHTYKAVLKDDSSAVFVHEGQPQQTSIRVFNIIVKKGNAEKLKLNDAEGGMKYIPKTDISGMSDQMQGLFTASLKPGHVGETEIEKVKQTGTFTYSGSETLSVGDVVAVYEGKHPNERTDEDREASIIYVEITEVSGTTYGYKTADAEDVLFTPDVLPVSSKKKTDSNTLTLEKSELEFSGSDFAEMGLNSDTTIDEGDFLAFYEGSWGDEDGEITSYGEIISVQENEENDKYIITYADVKDESVVYASMDIYTEENREIKLTDEQIREIEQDILTQAEESGFVEEAAEYLTALALETDGFQELAEDFDIQNYAVTFDDGTPVGEYGLSLMADSGRAQITKKEIKPTVHVGKLDHFENNRGIRVELNMELEITVDLGKDRSIVIDLLAVFEQEVMLSVNTSGGAIWKKKWIFPYIADYRLNANLDMGTYTGIGITATAQTKGKDDEKFDWGMSTGNSAGDKIIDIGKQIKELMDKKDKFLNYDLVGGKDDDDDDDDDGIPISGGLEEKYAAMIKEADESWIDIFRTEIFSQEGHVDPYYILCYGIKADFVMGASFYVTMGMTFTYEVAKRYNFSILLFARECTNDTIDLKAPEYEFTFYVMGTMGIRAGVEFEVGVGLFSLKLDSIGITAGAGVYVQMWGYFFYDLKGVKNSDTGKYEKTSQYSGAMLFEIGVYLKITFKAQLFSSKKLTYQPTLYENYWPFFTVGERENVLGFAEKDDDGNEIQTEYDMYAVRTLTLPSSLFSMRYLDMITGEIGGDEDENETTKVTEMKAGKNWDDETESHFIIEMSDSRYTYNPADNTVTVNPGGLSILPDCEMTIRWKSGTLAFSSEPIERKVIIRWSDPANVRYIAFDSQGGSPVRQILGDPGMAITLPKDPSKKGYDFGGWYTDSACSTPFALTEMPENFNGEKGTTVYAKWIPRDDTPYTVEHYKQELNGSYTLADTDSLTGTTDSDAAVTCKTNGEWSHFEMKNMPIARIAGNGTTVVRVYYDRKNYTVKFSYGSPSGVDANAIPAAKTYTAKYGATVYAPLLALRGYTFDGFFPSVPESGEIVVEGDASYHAQWTAGEADYRVEHYMPRMSGDGHILSGEDAVQKNTALSGSTVQVADLIRTIEGMTFQQAIVNGEEVTQTVISGDGSTVIRLYYSRNVHTLTLDPNGGTLGGKTEASVLQVAFDQRPGITAPERTGYDFAGWYTDVACAEENLFSTMPDRDLTLYAKWTPKSGIAYKVEHYRQDAIGDGYTLFETEELTGTTGAPVTATAKSYEHFSLNGSAAGAVPTGEIAADGSLVLKLYYDRKTFTVTYDPDGGTLEGNETNRTFRYGAAFSAPDVTRSGYGLDGWFDGTVKYDSTKTITADVTVTARWNAGEVNYNVEHYLQDTNGVYPDAPSYTDTKSGTTGAAIDLDALKRKDTGFTFDKSGQESYTIDSDGSTVVKLYYTRNKHTLRWDLGDGTAPNGYTQGEVYYGVPVTAPEVTKTGYICKWDSTPPVTMPDEDRTLTASWTPIKYKVVFDPNGGIISEDAAYPNYYTLTYDAEEEKARPEDFGITREHYSAKCWSMYKDGTEVEFEFTDVLLNLTAEDGATVTLYVVWTPVEYTFGFYHNGGTIEGGDVSDERCWYDYNIEDFKNGAIQMPTIKRDKYDFLGWYENEDFSGEPVTEISVDTLNSFDDDTRIVNYYAKWELSKVLMTYTLLPSIDNGVNTRVSELLAADAEELPDELVPGADLPTPQLADGVFVNWCTDLNEPRKSAVTSVPEDAKGDCQVYLVYAPYTLKTAKDLLGLRYACWTYATSEVTTGQTFTLGNDITLDTTWDSMFYFKGTFDGAGHTIIYNGANDQLFYELASSAVVQNLDIKIAQDIVIDKGSYGGLVAETVWGRIENVHVGGGTLQFKYNVIISNKHIGGIVASCYGTMINCTVGDPGNPLNIFKEVLGTSNSIGGVVGATYEGGTVEYNDSLSSERCKIYVTISIPEDFDLFENRSTVSFGGVIGTCFGEGTIFKSGEYDIYARLPEITTAPQYTPSGTIAGRMEAYAEDGTWFDYKLIESGAKVTAHSNIEAAYGSYNYSYGQKMEIPDGAYSHMTDGTPAAP